MKVLLIHLVFLLCATSCLQDCMSTADLSLSKSIPSLKVGAERSHLYMHELSDKRVGLIVNQTSRLEDQHIVDYLLSKGIHVTKIFAPEHGFRGDQDAGAVIDSSIDSRTGIEIVSIYGDQKKPSAATLADVDVLIFDIQDVGVRYYTYISSMHYMMEAAAEQNKEFIIFDRPNPNGFSVDGPVLDLKFQSFVGMHPIPLLHGMTVGELAQMINGESWLDGGLRVDLKVIPVANYNRAMIYDLPVKPSPNLPNAVSVALYPSLGFFEATPISIGRGTDFPFQAIGYSKFKCGDFSFKPRPIQGAAMEPKLNGIQLTGIDLRHSSQRGLNIDYLIDWHQKLARNNETFFERAERFDELAGTDQLRLQILAGMSGAEIRHTWTKGLNNFLKRRQKYLLYP